MVAAEPSLTGSGGSVPVTRARSDDEAPAWRPGDAEAAARASCCVGNGFGNETRRNCRDGVRRGAMAGTGD